MQAIRAARQSIIKSIEDNEYELFVSVCEQFSNIRDIYSLKDYEQGFENSYDCILHKAMYCCNNEKLNNKNHGGSTRFIDYIFQNGFVIHPKSLTSPMFISAKTIGYVVENYFDYFISDYKLLFEEKFELLYTTYIYNINDLDIENNGYDIFSDILDFFKIFMRKLGVFFEKIENIIKERKLYLTLLIFHHKIQNDLIKPGIDYYEQETEMVIKNIKPILLSLYDDTLFKNNSKSIRESLQMTIVNKHSSELSKLTGIIPQELVDNSKHLQTIERKLVKAKEYNSPYCFIH
jgi:hypothetical protein